MSADSIKDVVMIPVHSVRVPNPRVREKKKFEEIVRSISEQGLKRPITVTEAPPDGEGRPQFDLVCGQGRLEAFMALGQSEIPAIIRRFSKADSLIASLVENIARRRVRSLDQIRLIQWMQQQGNSVEEIAAKTGHTEKYLQGILKLLEQGEERVLDAVLHGRLPITIAVPIAGADDDGAQRMLLEAYERGAMKQATLSVFRKLIEQRKCFGKGYLPSNARPQGRRRTTTDGLILAYKQETQRQKLMVKKARACETRLLSMAAAFKALYADENFTTLLRAEELDTLPKFLLERIRQT